MLLGLADSGAHVSQLCDACFATDLLGNWVRDKEVMPLEQAIHKLTGEPAGGVRARAIAARSRSARPPTSWCSTPTRSLPARCAASATSPPTANGSSPTRPSACATSMVNGTVIREDDKPLDDALAARPGKLLRS